MRRPHIYDEHETIASTDAQCAKPVDGADFNSGMITLKTIALNNCYNSSIVYKMVQKKDKHIYDNSEHPLVIKNSKHKQVDKFIVP